MRIQQLDLQRYGHFCDKQLVLDCPASGCDLHLIVGPNETGKSTIREAICDLLYGFPQRSSMGFLHAMSDLEVSARISAGDESLVFTRLKKRKNDLRGEDNTTLSPDKLQAYIGNTDRSFYERMFCFDREQLQECARQMLNQDSDAGQILFESSAGIQGLHKYQKALEDEAEKFYAPKAKAGRLFYEALNTHKEAAKMSRDLAQDAATYRQAKKDLAEAKDDVEALMQEVAERSKRQAMLNRVRLAEPKLRSIDALKFAISQLGEAIVFPPNAQELLSETQRIISRDAPAIAREEEKLASLRSELDAIASETPFLDGASTLQRFIKAAGAASNYKEELQVHAGFISQAHKEIAGLCQRIGWDSEANQDPEYVLPRILKVKSLKVAASKIVTLEESLRKKSEELHQLVEERRLIEADAAAIIELPHAEVIEALKAGQRALASAADRADAQAKHAQIEASIQQQLANLAPWKGGIEALQSLSLLDESAAADARNAALVLQTKSEAREAELEKCTEERDDLAHRIMYLRKDATVISDEELAELRQSRDSALQKAFDDPRSEEAKAETLTLVRKADGSADERYLNAKASHELTETTRRLARLEEKIASHRQKLAALANQREEVHQTWACKMAGIGLADLAIEQYSQWFAKRKTLLELNAKAGEYAATAARYAQAQALAREAIVASVTKHRLAMKELMDIPRSQGASEDGPALELLIEALSDTVSQAERAHSRHVQAARELAKIDQAINDLKARVASEQKDLTAAKHQWREGLAKVGLAAESAPEMFDEIMKIIVAIDERATDIQRRQRERVDLMERELAELEEGRRALQQDFNLHDAPEDLATFVKLIETRLEQEKLARARRLRLQQEIGDAERFIDDTSRSIKQQRDTIEGLHRLAGTGSDEALQAALKSASEREDKYKQIKQIEEDLKEVSSGLAATEISAEIASLEGQNVTAQLLVLESESEDLEVRRVALLGKKIQAQQRLEQVAGSDAAAAAESRRIAAATDIQEAIDQYLRLKTRARLLAWSIDWFRRERQGPILKASSELFQQLSNGSFERLSVDVSDSAPKLTAVRNNLPNTGVEGLSEGARDQLYLALRLAAVQQHVTTATAMPFIADDLFMAFDDARAGAGFRALKGLSATTQVIYFSHHRHLVDIAKRVVPDINVVDL